MATKISRMGMPSNVLDAIAVVWKKQMSNRADWGSFGYKLYKMSTPQHPVVWGLNIWKINSRGTYKSLDVASVKDIVVDDQGMLVYLYERPPMRIYRDEI